MITLDTLSYKDRVVLNKDSVLELTTQQAIIEHYLKTQIDFNSYILSPLREDRRPSFSFKAYNNGVIIWQDWGTGMIGDAFKLVMLLKSCSFAECLRYIDQDMHLGIASDEYTEAEKQALIRIHLERQKKVHVKPKKIITVIPQGFTLSDYNYWKSFGISIRTLMEFDVVSAKYVYIDGKLTLIYSNSRPIYAYYYNREHTGEVKVYSPYNKTRFLFNGTNNNIDGILQLPDRVDKLILSKSRKDVMLLYEFGYHAVSVQSEVYKLNDTVLQKLKNVSQNIYVWYDNDRTGIENSVKLVEQYGFKSISTNSEAKDPTDFFKRNGYEATKKLIQTCLQN